MKTLKELLKTHELKNGDHFRWQYDNTVDVAEYSYWCKSQMCVWNGEKFKDWFWSMGYCSESYTLPEGCVLLSFMGNINDYEECNEYQLKYYDDSDILNRNHSNHSKGWGNCFFIKKGAKRSREKIKQCLLYKLEEAEYKISSAMNDKKIAEKGLANLNDPDYDLDNVYI